MLLLPIMLGSGPHRRYASLVDKYNICLRTGSKFSVHTRNSDLKVVDTSRAVVSCKRVLSLRVVQSRFSRELVTVWSLWSRANKTPHFYALTTQEVFNMICGAETSPSGTLLWAFLRTRLGSWQNMILIKRRWWWDIPVTYINSVYICIIKCIGVSLSFYCFNKFVAILTSCLCTSDTYWYSLREVHATRLGLSVDWVFRWFGQPYNVTIKIVWNLEYLNDTRTKFIIINEYTIVLKFVRDYRGVSFADMIAMETDIKTNRQTERQKLFNT
jgi:hypothetical protein